MDERWIRVRALFESACALPHDARAELLAACADTALRAEVATLLEAHDRIATGPAGSFLTRLDPQRTAVLLSDAGAAADVASGEMIGRYRVVRVLGRGGMGVVYLAHDPRLDRSVALKLLPPHLGMDATARQRFENEAKAASALDHPNIVTVYEIGDTPDGSIFIAMAFCEGTTLRDMLDAGPLPVPRAIELTTQIAHGLAAAHRRGIVHRDIKPGNIMVAADGTARIVDFGVAKTGSGAPVEPGLTPGTVAYMSPEQTRGSEVDARSDVWSLGVVLYEMLSGCRPFQARDSRATVSRIRIGEHEPIARLRNGAPAGLSRIVERCLRVHPADRFADAGAVAAALRALAPQARRRRIAAVMAVLVLATLAAVGIRSASAPEIDFRRVAVAPLENRTGGAELDELAGMAADWITHGLWQTGALGVVQLADDGERAIDTESQRARARAAGAGLLLAGGVYREGGAVRLHARILDVRDGSIVESMDPVSAPVATPLDAVAQLSERIRSALMARLDTQLTHLRAVSRPPRLDAYREYLAGRDAQIARDLPGALRHFRRAAALDSTFVLPHVTAAIVLNLMGATAAADSIVRTLEREPERLDAFGRAHVQWLRGRFDGDLHASQAAMRAAARLAPGSNIVNYQHADETLRLGRPREAAHILDAVVPERGELRGWLHYWQVLGTALHLQGDHGRELREARRARGFYTGDRRALLLELNALAALGRTRDIERLLAETDTRPAAGEPSTGALMLGTALELRAHARDARSSAAELANRLLERAVGWYESTPPAERSVRQRYELSLALGLLGRRTEARRSLMELAAAPDAAPGPSPLAPRGSPHFPQTATYHGADGVLAAQDADTAGVAVALSWLRAQDTRGWSAYWEAAVLAALGRQDEAVEQLQRAFAEGVPLTLDLHRAPELEPLRTHRAFRALMTYRD